MMNIDHYYVIIGGLLLVCFFYRVSLYALLAIAGCGMVAYVRRNQDSWRFALGYDDGFYGFICRPRRRRLRRTSTDQQQQSLETVLDDLVSDQSRSPVYSFRPQNCIASNSITPPRQRLYSAPGAVSNRLPFSHQTISPWVEQHSSSTTATSPETMSGRLKHSGIGDYPHVQLEPRRPTILSYCNSNMLKSRVTVKVALPVDKMHGCNTVPLPLAGTDVPGNSSSLSNSQADCSSVIEALRTNRKRPLKEDEHVNVKRRFSPNELSSDAPTPVISPHLPTEIAQHFESQLSDESLAILLPPESLTKKTSTSPIQTPSSLPTLPQPSPRPRMFARANTNAIESSYSSSYLVPVSQDRFGVPFYGRIGNRKVKRKNEATSCGAPDTKFSRESKSDVAMAPIEVDEPDENLENKTTPVLEPCVQVDVEKDAEKVPVEKRSHSGAFQNFHIPNYIPSLEDHLEDQRADQKRLEKLLGCFSKSTDKQKSADQPSKHEATYGQLSLTAQQSAINTDQTTDSLAIHAFPLSSNEPKPFSNLLFANSPAPLFDTTTSIKAISSDVSTPPKRTQPVATSQAEGAAATFSFGNGVVCNTSSVFNASPAFALGNSALSPNERVQIQSAVVTETPAPTTTTLSSLPPMISTGFGRSNGDGSMPTFGTISAAASTINGTPTTTAAQQPSQGYQFSFGTAAGTSGSLSTSSATASNPGFSFNAINAPPTLNFAGATTTGFTPVTKQPVNAMNMFSIGPSNSPVSSRRFKQTLQRHRSSHR